MHAVKACGKRHAWCRECRPDAASKIRDRALNRSPEHQEKLRLTRLGRVPSDATRARVSKALRGRVLSSGRLGHTNSAKARALVSAAKRKHMAECKGKCARVECSPPRSPTQIEKILARLLSEFPTVLFEHRIGPYRVDAYLPEYGLAFEADGQYWHRLTERDRPGYYDRRDEYLLMEHGVTIVRLGEEELLALNKIKSW